MGSPVVPVNLLLLPDIARNSEDCKRSLGPLKATFVGADSLADNCNLWKTIELHYFLDNVAFKWNELFINFAIVLLSQ